MTKAVIDAPRDAEADLITALHGFGVTAQTLVPADRGPGLVRVSRVGGDLTAQKTRDRPLMLVEVWEKDSVSAWDAAVRVWAAVRTMGHFQFLFDGLSMQNLELQAPRALDDDQAPGLFRVQFTAQYTVPLTTITLEAPNG